MFENNYYYANTNLFQYCYHSVCCFSLLNELPVWIPGCQDQGRGKIQAGFALVFENPFSFEFCKGGNKELIFKQRLKISFYANKKLAFLPANKLSIRLCLILMSSLQRNLDLFCFPWMISLQKLKTLLEWSWQSHEREIYVLNNFSLLARKRCV